MERVTITFEEEFNKFEPGETVKYEGDFYIVTEWNPPLCAGECAVVFLKGKHFGVDASSCWGEEVKDGHN